MASRRNGKDKSAIADDPSPTQRTALGGSKAIVMMLSHRLGREDLRDEGCCDEGVLVLRRAAKQCFPHTERWKRFVRVWYEAILGRKRRGPGIFREGFALDTWQERESTWEFLESSEDEREIYLLRANSIYDDF